jgi:hypothetical protein
MFDTALQEPELSHYMRQQWLLKHAALSPELWCGCQLLLHAMPTQCCAFRRNHTNLWQVLQVAEGDVGHPHTCAQTRRTKALSKQHSQAVTCTTVAPGCGAANPVCKIHTAILLQAHEPQCLHSCCCIQTHKQLLSSLHFLQALHQIMQHAHASSRLFKVDYNSSAATCHVVRTITAASCNRPHVALAG